MSRFSLTEAADLPPKSNLERLSESETHIEHLWATINSQQTTIDYLLKELDVLKTLILIFGSDRANERNIRPE